MPAKNAKSETVRSISNRRNTRIQLIFTCPIRETLEGTETTTISRAITEFEKTTSSWLTSEPTSSVKTTSYTESTALTTMSATVLPNTEALSNTRPNII